MRISMGLARIVACAACLLTTTATMAYCGYCKSYEDYLEGRWTYLDTLYCDSHGTRHRFWVGGNDYTLTTGDNATDKKLKKEALVLMKDDTLFINCRKLRFKKIRFDNGYAMTKRFGQDKLIFVNERVDREMDIVTGQMAFGLIGGIATANSILKQRVCYVISGATDEKGRFEVQMIDDTMMDKLISGFSDLHNEYYLEENKAKRILAKRVLPILKKAGLLHARKDSEAEETPNE